MSNNPPPTGHTVEEAHLPHFRTKLPSRIKCVCLVVITAPMGIGPDPHQPIYDEWLRHRREVSAGQGRTSGGGQFDFVKKGKHVQPTTGERRPAMRNRLEAAGRMSAAVRSGAVER